MKERDSLTDWFHALAENSFDALIRLASSENIDLLRLHVSRSTPEHLLPEALDASEFAETVAAFRKNERLWNHATMTAMIKSDGLYKAGRKAEAAEVLNAFSSSCPWSLFKEAALNQATHYM